MKLRFSRKRFARKSDNVDFEFATPAMKRHRCTSHGPKRFNSSLHVVVPRAREFPARAAPGALFS
eukprot:3569394-Pyramimonas_sp.AAC.1